MDLKIDTNINCIGQNDVEYKILYCMTFFGQDMKDCLGDNLGKEMLNALCR